VALVAAGAFGLFIFLYNGDPHLASATSTGVQITDRATEPSRQLALEAAGLDRLASKVDGLTEQIAALSASAERATAAKSTMDHHANALAQSRAGVEEDLSKLRTYAKDVADSVALIDAEVSDPAVLQKKLERQKAIAQK
jgi:hypothetical protein